MTVFADKLDAEFHDFWQHLPGLHHAPEDAPAPQPEMPEQPVSSEPSAPSPQVTPSQPEEPAMSLSDDLASLTAIATRLDNIGEDAVTKLEAVKANPDANRAFEAVAALSQRGQLSAAASAVVTALEALAQQP